MYDIVGVYDMWGVCDMWFVGDMFGADYMLIIVRVCVDDMWVIWGVLRIC